VQHEPLQPRAAQRLMTEPPPPVLRPAGSFRPPRVRNAAVLQLRVVRAGLDGLTMPARCATLLAH